MPNKFLYSSEFKAIFWPVLLLSMAIVCYFLLRAIPRTSQSAGNGLVLMNCYILIILIFSTYKNCKKNQIENISI
jgi:hypothetical protein